MFQEFMNVYDCRCLVAIIYASISPEFRECFRSRLEFTLMTSQCVYVPGCNMSSASFKRYYTTVYKHFYWKRGIP